MFARLRSFLEQHEVENHLFLGVLASAPEGTRPVLAEMDGKIAAACVFVERNAVAAGDTRFVPNLLEQWQGDVPGLVARTDLAEVWAAGWVARRGCQAKVAYDQRIYQLETVLEPRSVEGNLRPAGPRDVDQLTAWIEGFTREALAHEPVDQDAIRAGALRRSQSNLTYFWEVGRHPVAMAALARPTRNVIGVNLVYTPPELRGRGYASAVVAAVSREGLDRGHRLCALYTDLANETSNRIYKKLGYQPVCDSRQYLFQY